MDWTIVFASALPGLIIAAFYEVAGWKRWGTWRWWYW